MIFSKAKRVRRNGAEGVDVRNFRAELDSARRIVFDGAMGTVLQMRGLLPGVSPELFCLERPDVLQGVHADYAAAGADVLTTNTFGGTRFKLPESLEPVEFNRRMAGIARRAADAAGRTVYVAGSIGPTGKFLKPLGELDFEILVGAFREQIRGLIQGGADLLIIETQFDISEARAAVVAARREGNIPIAVSMTYEAGTTLTGSPVAVCAATLSGLGVDLVGMNCSAGPLEMAGSAAELLEQSPLPVLIQPNAGLPRLEGERTVFPLGPEDFAEATAGFAAAGAQAVGGCCGTTPEHIAALVKRVRALGPVGQRPVFSGVALTSRSSLVRLGADSPFICIGERINPTGKKQLTAELQAGEFTTALRFAEEQLRAGAPVLDVNVGAPMVDEIALLPALVQRLASAHSCPLCVDSANPEAVAAALAVYPASPLVNSISGEEGRMDLLGPLCRDFGAPFILLPLKGKQLPERAAERIAIVEGLLARMEALGIPRRLAVVDILALTVSSTPTAARECLEFARWCAGEGLPTVCGLSNISFGLPARELLNAAFAASAAGAGLCGCIANPSNRRLMETLDSMNVLLAHDPGAEAFIAAHADHTPDGPSSPSGNGPVPRRAATAATLEEAVILGRREAVEPLLEAALAAGEEPYALVNDRLIPAINEVGVKYERREYFLPQLIRSAETLQAAFAILRPLLEKSGERGERPVVVMATVQGDIHDIGKNIVNLMLENHGFEVVDLGKDVPAETIVETAVEKKADCIGLSALMTTTMVRMRDTVELLAARNLSIPVMVGGAVVTPAFAGSIGAHHSGDAVGAVRLARRLVGGEG